MGWLGQMLCSWGSFWMICQRPHTDWEKDLPSIEYGVTIWRTFWDLMLWSVCGEWCHGSGGGLWRCSERWYLTRIFCQGEILWGNLVLFVVSYHLQWGGCVWGLVKNMMLSWYLSEWLERKVRNACNQLVSCTVLWRVRSLLWCGSSCLGRIFVWWSVER